MLNILVFGEPGSGKSTIGNAILRQANAFETSDLPFTCTTKIISRSNIINDIKINFIDTQGIDDDFTVDSIKKTFLFLQNWRFGINAIFIVVSIFKLKFESNIQKIIQMMNEFFNDPKLWNQVGIIFTKCYKNQFNRKTAEKKYRMKVIDYVMKLPGCQKISPQIPCFFVDSLKWKTDEDTRSEFSKAFRFVSGFAPIHTKNLKMINPEYRSIEDEINSGILIGFETSQIGKKLFLIYYYEDQKRQKITGYDGEVTYTESITIKRYTKTEEIELEPHPILPPIEIDNIL